MITGEGNLQPAKQSKVSTLCVYLAFLLTSWKFRMTWFAAGIFMMKLEGSDHDSLKLTAIFTFTLSGSSVAFGALVGHWVDVTNRERAIQISTVIQNVAMMISTLTMICCFHWETQIRLIWDGWMLTLLKVVVLGTSALYRVANIGSTIIQQKDWIVLLSGDDRQKLATTNAIYRSIDLASLIISSLVIGVIQDQVSVLASAIVICLWHFGSLILEVYLNRLIYRRIPVLSYPDRGLEMRREKLSELKSNKRCIARRLMDSLKNYGCAWKSYFCHEIALAGGGMALLFMTVMSFDAVTTAYGSTKLSSGVIGGAQGAASALGMLSTICFPFIRLRLGLENTGFVGALTEVSALVICVVSIWLPGSPFQASSFYAGYVPTDKHDNESMDSIIAFICGVILSRFGLWLSDITITQILQEKIEEDKRGTINGVQDSLNMICDMIKSILVIVFPYPEQFGFLIIISFLSVTSGYVLFLMFYLKQRWKRMGRVIEDNEVMDSLNNCGDNSAKYEDENLEANRNNSQAV